MHKVLLLLSMLLLSAACADQETPWPDYRQDLADLQTDATGCATLMVLDDGSTRSVKNLIYGVKPDTTLRVLALYSEQGAEGAWIADYAPILVSQIAKYSAEALKADPVGLVSCWRGQDYINLRLSIKGSNGHSHYFGFHQTDYLRHANGARTMCATLLHNQNNDPLYYSREAYLSLPLRPLDHLLKAGRDTIRLTIKTFEGEKTKNIPF